MAMRSQRKGASSLPAELMSLVYSSLSQPDLLAAAAVSSWWRTNAVNDKNYYRAWTVAFPNAAQLSVPRASEYADLAKFASVVDDSETCRYLLGLSIFIDLDDPSPSGDYWRQDRSSTDGHFTASSGHGSDEDGSSTDSSSNVSSSEDTENKTALRTIVIPTLLRALPRVVVLDLYPCVYSVPLLWDCLTSPAPVLRSLEIRAGLFDPLGEPETPPLPAHFLAGDAPRLEEVYLIMTVISPSTPSFPSVRRLRLAYQVVSPAFDTVFTCFPNMRDLEITCIPDRVNVTSEECEAFSQLDSLRLGPHNVAQLMGAFPAGIEIPFIKYSSRPVSDAIALLHLPGPLSVCLSEYHLGDDAGLITRPTQVALEVTSPSAVRLIDSGASVAIIELLETSRCAERIAQLTIDDRHVRSLIQICGTMPGLRTLQIVLITWHALGPNARLTRDEVMLYRAPHVRNDCQCLGGPFSDWHDGGAPDSTCCPKAWPALQTVELCATRADSIVPAAVLRGLADALTPAADRPLELVLSNGLLLTDDAPSALFSEIRGRDSPFCAWRACVGRARKLLAAAARKKVETHQQINMMLQFKGPDFHWEECDRWRAKDDSDRESETEPGPQPE